MKNPWTHLTWTAGICLYNCHYILINTLSCSKTRLQIQSFWSFHRSRWASERRFGLRRFRASGWSDTLFWWWWDSFILMFLHDGCDSDFGGWPVFITFESGADVMPVTSVWTGTCCHHVWSWMFHWWLDTGRCPHLADRVLDAHCLFWCIFCIPCLCCSRAALSPLLCV